MVLHRSSAWLTQQKRNSKLVATLIVPAAEADSGMSVITSRLLKEWPSLWIPIFPPPPSLSVSDLPPPPPPAIRKKGMSANSRVEDTALYAARVAPSKPARLFSLAKHWLLETLVVPGRFSARALQVLSSLCAHATNIHASCLPFRSTVTQSGISVVACSRRHWPWPVKAASSCPSVAHSGLKRMAATASPVGPQRLQT